jgi:hypothetical protein
MLKRVERLGLKHCTKRPDSQQSLCLYRDDALSVFYAPFDPARSKRDLAKARVFFVGLTPGFRQVRAKFNDHFHPAEDGSDRVSFVGAMRTNLVRLMDRLGLPDSLGIDSTADLFAEDNRLAAKTSLLKFPVYRGSKYRNYSGSPEPEGHPFLRRMIDEIFVPELRNLNRSALIVPFGMRVEAAVRAVMDRMDPDMERRVLWGFPHPSGANSGTIAKFLKSDLAESRKKIRSVLR